MRVDPTGLVSAAQRIAAAVAGLTGGDPVHPPLAADPTSAGAAARLSTSATTLAANIGAQAAALAATAGQLGVVAAGFADQEAANGAAVATLSGAAAPPAPSGWAPPPPPAAPDLRPPLDPPVPLPGEVIAHALHAGSPTAGQGFIAGWTQVATATEEAADLLRRTAAELPDTWDSALSTPLVHRHLIGYAAALRTSASRARAIAEQAARHREQNSQALIDVPPPAAFDAVNQQLKVVTAANLATGGKYAAQMAALSAQKSQLETQAQQGYSTYHAATDASTAADPASADPNADGTDPAAAGDRTAPDGTKGDPRAAGVNGAVSPESAGQLAAMLPQMIPTVLGAAGGLVGGALSSIGKVPEALMQAAAQATQELSGLKSSGLDDPSKNLNDAGSDLPHVGDLGAGGGGGGGDTTPAGGAPTSPPAAVLPSTGAAVTPGVIPAGGLRPPAQPAGNGTGVGMPMGGMPLGGMMPHGGGGGAGADQPVRPKQLVVPRAPHTESVTGKVSEDRIAASATKGPREPDPPDDDPPSGRPVIRRIVLSKDEL